MENTQTPTEAGTSLPLLAAKLEEIGPYRLKGIVGEGGMGSVYRAEQTDPVWREVAIKVTRIDLSSAGSLARFEAERQILATLNHPNVAQVYEAGATPDGFPYMVMEFIEGVGLRRYCDEQQLDLRARIALFIEVCGAVQFAHQRGVIHRDIKPSNILVDHRSGAPVPKLIDFGIAKLAAAAPSEHTRAGGVLGTPIYMSPEQLDAASDVDTRTDVYSLGVVLYQLLAGVLPHDEPSSEQGQRTAAPDSLATRPSRRLVSAPDAERIATARGTTLDGLRRALSEELDWVVLRAVAPERDRRYGSAADLAADLKRYLDGRPVEARSLTRGYVLRKFVARHRVETALLMALLLAIALAVLFVLDAWRNEHEAHQQSEVAASQAAAVNAFLLDMLGAPDPRVSGRDVLVVDVLENAAQKAKSAFPDQPLVRAELLETLGRSYAGLAEQERAVDLIRESLKLRREALGPDSELALETENELNEAEFPLVTIDSMSQRMGELLQRAVPALGETHPVSLTALNNYGTVLVYAAGDMQTPEQQQQMKEALEIQQRNLQLRTHVYGIDDERTTHARNNLATTLQQMQRNEESVALFRDNLERQRRLFGEDNHYTLTTMDNLAISLERLGQRDEALSILRRSLAGLRRVDGEDHPTTLQSQNTLAGVLINAGQQEEGVALYEDVLRRNAPRGDDDYNSRLAIEGLAGQGIQVTPAAPAEPAEKVESSDPAD